MPFRRRNAKPKRFANRRSKYMSRAKAARAGVARMLRQRAGRSFRRNLRKNIEVKRATYNTNQVGYNSTIDNNDVAQLMPDIGNNIGSTGRIGQSIRLLKMTVDVQLMYDQNTAGPNIDNSEVLTRAFILKQKDTVDWRLAIGGGFKYTQLLESGENGQDYNGTVLRHYRKVNNDVFVKKKQKFGRLQAYNFDTGTASLGVVGTSKSFRHFTWKMKFGKNGKKLLYGNLTDTQPLNFPYFFCFGYCYPSGAAADTITTRVLVQYLVNVWYTDL